MTTHYIDPTSPTNGAGTFADPYNAWGITSWWVPGDTYLQKEGTTYTSAVVVYNNGPYYIGTYNAFDGAILQTKTRRAKIIPGDARPLALGTMGTRQNITVDSLELIGPRTSTTLREGISNTAAAIDTYVGVTVRRCKLDGNYGAQIKGAGILFEDCEVLGTSDGLVLQSSNQTVRRCSVVQPANADDTWDGISCVVTGAVAVSWLLVENNTISASRSWKQGVYVYAGGGTATAPTGPVVIQNNMITGFNQNIYSACDGTRVLNNELIDAKYYLDQPNGDSRHITLIANNCEVRGNLARSAPWAKFLALTCTSGTTLVHNNTGIELGMGISAPTGTHTVQAYNNVLSRAPQAGRTAANTRLINLLSTVTLTASNNRYYWPDGSIEFLVGGTTYTDWASYQAARDATSLFENPALGTTYSPSKSSSLYRGGRHVSYNLDRNGYVRWDPPTIGAHEVA
jgi:hypothetical protein